MNKKVPLQRAGAINAHAVVDESGHVTPPTVVYQAGAVTQAMDALTAAMCADEARGVLADMELDEKGGYRRLFSFNGGKQKVEIRCTIRDKVAVFDATRLMTLLSVANAGNLYVDKYTIAGRTSEFCHALFGPKSNSTATRRKEAIAKLDAAIEALACISFTYHDNTKQGRKAKLTCPAITAIEEEAPTDAPERGRRTITMNAVFCEVLSSCGKRQMPPALLADAGKRGRAAQHVISIEWIIRKYLAAQFSNKRARANESNMHIRLDSLFRYLTEKGVDVLGGRKAREKGWRIFEEYGAPVLAALERMKKTGVFNYYFARSPEEPLAVLEKENAPGGSYHPRTLADLEGDNAFYLVFSFYDPAGDVLVLSND